MKCTKCGTEFEGGICPNGCNSNTTQKAKKPIFKKWWFWVIIAVLAVLILSPGEADTDPTGPKDTTPIQNATSPVDTTVGATEKDNVYRPGDVIDANGLKITYVSVEEYVSDNMFMQPEDGSKYIRLKLSAENTSNSDKYISSFEFTCYADGVKTEIPLISEDGFTGGALSAGRKTEGYIYFTVPANAAEIEVEYETSFWSGKKAILLVEL